MVSFFRGWHRKCGIAALAMALLFLTGRFRSDTYSDSFSFPVGASHRANFDSENGYLFFEYENAESAGSYPANWRTLLSCDANELYLYYRDPAVGWRFLCFAVGVQKRHPNTIGESTDEIVLPKSRTWFVSYWSVVVPLTLLSAWLLLSKPRQMKTKAVEKPTE